MVKQIVVGEKLFEKKGDAVAFFQGMLNKYDLGDKVSADDTKLLEQLLKGHPDATEKIGSGIIGFSVRAADYGTRCFWVNRKDGTTEKFSFRSCLT